jgi:hypothetical protein
MIGDRRRWVIEAKYEEAMAEKRTALRFLCVDCGKDTGGETGEYYMVYDQVWAASGLGPNDGMLCLACLENRIGRPLTMGDFTAMVPSLEAWRRYERKHGRGP